MLTRGNRLNLSSNRNINYYKLERTSGILLKFKYFCEINELRGRGRKEGLYMVHAETKQKVKDLEQWLSTCTSGAHPLGVT